ncbi:MAG TPA: flagellum-specific ATP synthase FliI [Gammaproteobacteria bacterium]|nr:MAG: FliI/YscN family ATPase [OM182 bacterium]HAL40796.1 flagellum-specific ATP synthase FliI [Gammaproteobacteria bacterium]HBK17927.1 flagellum-specific ATP synthase FliI [Gammaproteobacteria bacterium]|tara:strand:+ start:9289 stop:10659 length:1371 start_codon:yes stop_codon:yes gene_type:complete
MNAAPETPSFRQHVDDVLPRLACPPVRKYGVLTRIVGLTIEAKGITATVGAICRIMKPEREAVAESDPRAAYVDAQVVGFQGDTIYLMPLWEATGLQAGARVFLLSETDSAGVGEALLGRVVDALGTPLDGLSEIECHESRGLQGETTNPMQREPITKVLDVGVKAINALLTAGCGQRLGLIAGSGVGKSVLLGMLTKFTSADVVVIGLIGERGREVKEFIEQILGVEGMQHAVVVAAPADNAPLLRLRATELAHLYAEYFRARGKDVLLLVDSLTRVAHAQREIGLAIGEPPTSKGYPPSVFSLLPNLIERTGTGKRGEGTVTALYTLLAEGDDLNDPIVDLARASLDGQVVLSRALADAAHYPAIDLAGSISRLMPTLADSDDLDQANTFRRLWTLYQQNLDLIQVGAYEMGTNPDLDRAIALRGRMEAFLRQPMDELSTFEESISGMRECLHV